MDFSLPPELAELQARVRDFIAHEIIPMEADPRQGPHGPELALREDLIERARRAGLLSPHASAEYGGMGLSHAGRAIAFEEAGYSLLGPVAMNVFAPDEGNMHLLEAVATPAQKERWLRPLAEGHIRSCFCMTEPSPGAGSDPSMLQTTATPDGEGWRIDGLKWFITGADGAGMAIIMARVPDSGATMFLSRMDAPGITVERSMETLDRCFPGGHGVVRFDGLRVGAGDVLGELGQGFQYAQVRLSPARLTHCMRWLGAARRAHDIAVDYARHRQAFGKLIGQHEGVGFALADNEMDLHIARLAIWHCAWTLDQGGLALRESSRAKVIVSEALWRVVDRSVQVLGGQGVTGETLVARIFADMRGFRIYDGPSEVHRWSLAKHILRGAAVENRA
ncbi:acyl-CoA dehydrogenase family protein [Cupriavidus pinatubonensis]|uniref:acyl-CoA dehydrogenase family protein n=1 Tax=Cupriavidus pinatubonensis TaxID=248026 RepID=UPI001CC6AE05|nr:acyl-CoA dehydrogenase family protein [Cupriavidus pinatubonensis]